MYDVGYNVPTSGHSSMYFVRVAWFSWALSF